MSEKPVTAKALLSSNTPFHGFIINTRRSPIRDRCKDKQIDLPFISFLLDVRSYEFQQDENDFEKKIKQKRIKKKLVEKENILTGVYFLLLNKVLNSWHVDICVPFFTFTFSFLSSLDFYFFMLVYVTPIYSMVKMYASKNGVFSLAKNESCTHRCIQFRKLMKEHDWFNRSDLWYCSFTACWNVIF